MFEAVFFVIVSIVSFGVIDEAATIATPYVDQAIEYVTPEK